MAAHSAIPGRSPRPTRSHGGSAERRQRGIIPAVLGVVYGIYASFIARDAGPVTGWDVGFGVICAVIVAGLCFLLGRTQRAMIPLVRAAAYGTLFGVALGFLHNLADNTILNSSVVGLALGAGMTAAAFYVFYTREQVGL